MKRYLAFFAPNYYPTGGMNDCIGDFDTKEEAILEILNSADKIAGSDGYRWSYHWAEVFDYDTEEVVWKSTHENGYK